MIESEVNKGGENIFRVEFEKSIKTGCRLSVWAHPLIEDFIARQMLNAPHLLVSEYDQHWVKVAGSEPLMAYQLPSAFPTSSSYSMLELGGLLTLDTSPGRRGMPNLSILRLVGISKGPGVTFGYNRVGSTDYFDRLAKLLGDGVKMFYYEHLKPINISVSLHAQRL